MRMGEAPSPPGKLPRWVNRKRQSGGFDLRVDTEGDAIAERRTGMLLGRGLPAAVMEDQLGQDFAALPVETSQVGKTLDTHTPQ